MNRYNQRRNNAGAEDKKTGKAILMIFMGMIAGLLIAVGVAVYISNMPIPFIKQEKPAEEALITQAQDDQLPLLVEGGNNQGGLIPQNNPVFEPDDGTVGQSGDPVADIAGMNTTVQPADATVAPLQAKPVAELTPEEAKKAQDAAKAASDKKPQDKAAETPKNQYDFYNVLPKEGDSTKPAKPSTPPAAASAKPKAERYYLQAGAFKSAQDADNLKASLALMGVEARIQTIIGADNTSVHRVRVGPLTSQAEAESVQKKLSGSRVSTDIIKVTP